MYAKITQGPSIPKYRPSTVNYSSGITKKKETLPMSSYNYTGMSDFIPPISSAGASYDQTIGRKPVTAARGVRGSLNATTGLN